MRRKLVFLFFLIGIIGSILGIIKVISMRTSQQGILKINCQPEASIFLDNKLIGKTPYEDKISQGEYALRLEPESTINQTVSWQGRVIVQKNLLTFVNIDLSDSEFTTASDILWLEKISGGKSEIAVTTNPDGATINLDSEFKGNSPVVLTDIISGDHTLLVSTPGFFSRQLKIKTHPGYKLVASVRLALSTLSKIETESATDSGSMTINQESSESAKPSKTPTPTILISKSNISTDSASNPQKPYIIISDTPTGFLRVRIEPSVASSESSQVKPGQKFSILDTNNGWYQINYEADKIGWVSGQYVEKVE